MAGANRWHNLIVANVVGELRSQLEGRPCTTNPSDMRVKVNPTGLYTYPDVIVVCGEAQFEDNQQDTLLNPTLIVSAGLGLGNRVSTGSGSTHRGSPPRG
jgi:Uma2 family endonuclease